MNKTRLIPAYIFLNFCQCKYVYYILSMPDCISIKEILPFVLQVGDGDTQSKNKLDNNLM